MKTSATGWPLWWLPTGDRWIWKSAHASALCDDIWLFFRARGTDIQSIKVATQQTSCPMTSDSRPTIPGIKLHSSLNLHSTFSVYWLWRPPNTHNAQRVFSRKDSFALVSIVTASSVRLVRLDQTYPEMLKAVYTCQNHSVTGFCCLHRRSPVTSAIRQNSLR